MAMKNNKTSKIGPTPKVSDVEIIEAGQKLAAINKNITGFSLRQTLGGKGDFKRLMKVWTEYDESQTSNDDSSLPLTSEVKSAIDDATLSLSQSVESIVTEIFNKVSSGAQEHIYAAINLAESRQKKADAEMHDAMNIIKELEDVLSTTEISLKESESVVDELRHTNTELTNEIKGLHFDLQEQCKLLEVASMENEELIKSNEITEAHVESLRQSNEDLRADKASLQKEVEYIKKEAFKKSQEHERQIRDALNNLESKFDSAA